MMHDYDWKSHYDAHIKESTHDKGFQHYQIESENGTGELIFCSVFSGVQVIYNDLHFLHCSKQVPPKENIVEVTYCIEGRYECRVNSRYCFYIGHGDLCIGTAGRREAGGGFPTRRFRGITLFMDLDVMDEQFANALREMGINLGVIRKLAIQKPRRFLLHDSADIRAVFLSMAEAERSHSLRIMKIRVMELLMLLCDSDFGRNDMPVYINRKLVKLANDVHQRITADLSCHLTLAQLSSEFRTSPTTIKTAFKSVYGESLRAYLKSYRMQEAQRLLRETNLPISEIAVNVGYANPGHFAVTFRREFDMMPSEYKKVAQFEQPPS